MEVPLLFVVVAKKPCARNSRLLFGRQHAFGSVCAGAFFALLVAGQGCVAAGSARNVEAELGRQRTVALGSCTLEDHRPSRMEVWCSAGSWLGFAPLLALAGFSFFCAVMLLKSDGYARTPSGTALGIAAAVPGFFLCYVTFEGLQERRFTVDLGRRELVYESRLRGLRWLVAREVSSMDRARCTYAHSPGNKNSTAGWVLSLHTSSDAGHFAGKVLAERDAQAVCRYLLPAR